MGENTITNIMKVSVAGTSLNDGEKKVYESLCEKKQQSGRWRKQKLQVQNISFTEVYISVTTTTEPTKKSYELLQ